MALNKRNRSVSAFLVRPLPVPGEPSQEYLQRVAHRNRLAGVVDYMRLFGTTYSELATLPPAHLHSVFSGEDIANFIGARSRRPPHVSTLIRQGISTFARVCSSCLRESDILDPTWCLPLSISCPRHNCFLIDRCPVCSKFISRMNSQYRCACGFAFTCTEPEAAPTWAAHFISAFAPWRSQDNSNPAIETFISLEFGMVRLIRDLTVIGETCSMPRSNKSTYLRKYWLSADEVETIGRLMSEWPTALTGALADAMTVSKEKRKYWKNISSTSVEIAKFFEIAREAANTQRMIVAKANRRSRALTADSTSNLIRELEIDERTAGRLIEDQHWKNKVFELAGYPSGGSLISAVRTVVKATIPFKKAIEELRSPKMLLAAILQRGYLPYFRYGKRYSNIRLWPNDIGKLVELLRAEAIAPSSRVLQTLRLADLLAMTKYTSALQFPSSIYRLIDEILSGKAPLLRMVGHPKTFDDFGLPAEYVRRVLKKDASISLERAMQIRQPTRV